jgi:hypothetical protein
MGYMSPYPTVVMVTTDHQNACGILLNISPLSSISAKYIALENSTIPKVAN